MALLQVEIKLDENCAATKIVIYTREMTDEIADMANRLSNGLSKMITGSISGKIYILKPDEILSFYAENQKVFAKMENGIYQVRHRLYELEEMFENTSFIRISNSAIANLEWIANLDLSIGGSMSLKFKNGSTDFVSRRYVSKIKNYLGL